MFNNSLLDGPSASHDAIELLFADSEGLLQLDCLLGPIWSFDVASLSVSVDHYVDIIVDYSITS